MAKAVIISCVVVVVVLAAIAFYFQHKNNSKPNGTTISNIPNFNAIVSKNKPDAYNTIMEAIASAPTYSEAKYFIHIEAGVYVERVEVWSNKTNIVIVGDGEATTKISWSRRYPDFATIDTATVAIQGHGFIAMFITFENNAGDGSSDSQAVAVLSISDQSAFYRCTFLSYQDTLYAKNGAQFYRECNIYGTVDFIFGAARAVFQSCNLYSRLPRTSPFTSQNKGTIYSLSGFVLQNCTLTVAPGLEQQKSTFEAYLGRPWSNYSTVVVMESFLDSIVKPEGWLSWEGRNTDTLTYREFMNRGPGAATDGRVNWKGFKVVTDPNELRNFTVGQFINDKDWLRDTLIPYDSGYIYVYE